MSGIFLGSTGGSLANLANAALPGTDTTLVDMNLAPGAYTYEVTPTCTNGVVAAAQLCMVDVLLEFVRGDCNGDGIFNGLTDGLKALNFQFIPGSCVPPCLVACDANGNRVFNGLLDGLYLLSFQFVPGSPPPPPPFPGCGPDQNGVTVLGCNVPPPACNNP